MSGVYKVKKPKLARTESAEEELEAPAPKPGIVLLWGAATATGVLAGWYLVQESGVALLWGIPMAILQGLLLLPNWKRALGWTMLTSVGWLLALAFMFLLAFPLDVLGTHSLETYDYQLPWAILLLILVGVPIVTFVQCSAINNWARGDNWSMWFGASACSFPIAALFGALIIDILAPATCLKAFSGCLPGVVQVQSIQLTLFVTGALWGGCLGWAMAKMPEVRTPG